MSESLKIVIPMAGWGTRMRPHTWSKPKPLVALAGRTALDYLLDTFATVPEQMKPEYVFILGPYLGETQIPPYIAEHYPSMKAHYVVQAEMKGQSHALHLAREHLTGPVISCFSDTLIETDFSSLHTERADGIAWVQPVPDPRRFGVAELDARGHVTRLIEKPQSMDNNLVLVGCYYFRSGIQLIGAVDEQMKRGVQLKNEYFMADAINIMLERGAYFRSQQVDSWLDAGTIAATLETNRILLDRRAEPPATRPGVTFVPPVAVHPSANISDSVIGPHASIGAGCTVSNASISDSIVDAQAMIRDISLTASMVGARAQVAGAGRNELRTVNLGDDSCALPAA